MSHTQCAETADQAQPLHDFICGEAEFAINHELDAREMSCPLPILQMRAALQIMPSGETLRVLATDPGAVADFAAFCRTTGHVLLAQCEDGDVLEFIIRKN